MRKNSSAVTALATVLTAIVIGLAAPCAQAQRQVQLITFTGTPWRYDASGANQMTAWRARTFNDSTWPSGMGLLGGFNGAPDVYPYPFNTLFPTYNDQTITYYFRAHFNMAASDYVWPLTLLMSNLVDDGCLVYLNSNLVNTIRVAANAPFNTPATGGPAVEGAYEPSVNILTNGLLVGDNVIAVEVHQNATGSSDITMGLSLTALVPAALSITTQPQAQFSTTVGASVTLSVGLAGGPGLYQWQTNNGSGTFVNVAGATSTNYTFSPTAGGSWVFRFVGSNGLGMVISSNSTVTAGADKSGPLMLSAQVLEDATRTNRILISWNENLLPSTVNFANASNFTVMLIPSNLVVGISNIQYNPGTFPDPTTPPSTTLTMNTSSNWFVRSNYCITVNNVRDNRNNVVAPNSRICVAWPSTTNVMQMSDNWDFFDQYFLYNAFTGTNIFTLPWMATNFVVDRSYWGNGPGILYKDSLTPILVCAGDTLGTEISIQDNPTLFRRAFMLPTNVSAGSVQFKLRYIIDDGAVFFLNGREMFQVNMGSRAVGTPITETTLGGTTVNNATCVTNDNFTLPANIPIYPGMNWIAAAVCQENPLPGNGADDIAFGLEMDVRVYGTAPVLTNPVPRLTITKPTPTSARISWNSGFGYALESSPALRGPSVMWMEVQPNMANPMVITNFSGMGSTCFFRLRKVQLQ